MQRVTDHVKAKYRRKGLAVSSSTWPPFHAQSFTNLALIHQKMPQLQAKKYTTKIARVRTTGDIHKIPELTSSIKLDNIHQIFTPITSDDQTQYLMSILIEGHPGIGKTTLAKEMCLQWAKNKLLTSDKLVLLLMLRDPNVQKINSIEQLVKYTQPTDQVECVVSYLEDGNGVGVTLIIDGFDELSTELRQTSFFRKLIEGDVLYNARVVVTSRPSASACLHQYVHRRIEVLGFEKSSKEQYVNNALKDAPEKLRKLKVHFQQYPNIDALCYIPLNMVIIVYLCLLGSLPPTTTKMYESFILHTICRHLKRIGKSVIQIEKFPQPVGEVLEQLQKVAFDGLVKDKIVFTVEELPGLCKDDPTCYGLLQSTECYSAEEIGNPTHSFNFLHLGIQEYFAAKYVTTLLENEVYLLLKESFIDTKNPKPESKSVRLSNMWILYCGITSGQCKMLRHCLTTYKYKSKLNLMFQPSLTIPLVSPPLTPPTHPVCSRYPSRSQITSYPPPYHFPTATSEKITGPGPSSNQIISSNVNISQYILKDRLKVLYLFQCFQEAEDDELCEILSNSFSSSEIDIHNQSLISQQTTSLGFFLSKSHRKWRKLNLSRCHIGDHGMSIIHQYLCGDKASKHKIAEINLNNNDLTGASSHLVADIIANLQTYDLRLSHNKLTNMRDISTALINNSTITILHLNYNNLTAQEAVALSDMMICLEELNISSNKLGEHGAELLSEGIHNTKTLKILSISFNSIGPLGATAIANALTNNTSLEKLYMGNNEVVKAGTIAIAEAITNNKTLKLLSLSDDTMDKESAMVIMRSLHCNDTITDLKLCYTLYDDVEVEIVMINNRRNKCNIQKLTLRG